LVGHEGCCPAIGICLCGLPGVSRPGLPQHLGDRRARVEGPIELFGHVTGNRVVDVPQGGDHTRRAGAEECRGKAGIVAEHLLTCADLACVEEHECWPRHGDRPCRR
jgi:hypothetical protein